MKILMVCMGNICRSPLAEGIMKSKLPETFLIDSAGTIAMHEGQHPDKRAIKTAENHGIDISRQRARQIKKVDLKSFDKIFCMDLQNLEEVISLAENEEERKKISLLLEAAGSINLEMEVPDPYWDGMEEFEKVYQILDKTCSKIARKLSHE